MKALVTGATGFVGRALVAALAGPNVLVRDPSRAPPGAAAFAWDAEREVPADSLDGVDVVFHLAGEPVAEGRWSPAKKARIESSRVQGTRNVVRALERAARRPSVLVCASAVGYYGSRRDEILTERSGPGDGFLAEVCAAWEREARAAEELGVRVVLARLGIVLGAGGALAAMLPAFRVGLGGPLGDGSQWMPWVHLDDAIGMLRFAAARDEVRGPMNVCAPEPTRSRDFARALGKALRRPAFFAVPRLAMRVVLGETADVVLSSQRAVPELALRLGYRFQRPFLAEALAGAVRNEPTRAAG